MKKLFVLIAVFTLGFAFYAKAQYMGAQELPAGINQEFAEKNAAISQVEWEKDGKLYKVTFNVNQYTHQIVYDQNGKVLMQSTNLPVTSLPTDVVDGYKKNFAALDLKEVSQIVQNGKVSYQLSLNNGSDVTERVLMTPDGRVIRTDFDQE